MIRKPTDPVETPSCTCGDFGVTRKGCPTQDAPVAEPSDLERYDGPRGKLLKLKPVAEQKSGDNFDGGEPRRAALLQEDAERAGNSQYSGEARTCQKTDGQLPHSQVALAEMPTPPTLSPAPLPQAAVSGMQAAYDAGILAGIQVAATRIKVTVYYDADDKPFTGSALRDRQSQDLQKITPQDVRSVKPFHAASQSPEPSAAGTPVTAHRMARHIRYWWGNPQFDLEAELAAWMKSAISVPPSTRPPVETEAIMLCLKHIEGWWVPNDKKRIDTAMARAQLATLLQRLKEAEG